MPNNISDIKVNITIEDVVNPAAFGGICIYAPTSTTGEAPALPYTEAYSYDEAKAVIGAGGMKETMTRYTLDISSLTEGTVQKAQLDALNTDKYTFTSTSYSVEDSKKTINGKTYQAIKVADKIYVPNKD